MNVLQIVLLVFLNLRCW